MNVGEAAKPRAKKIRGKKPRAKISEKARFMRDKCAFCADL